MPKWLSDWIYCFKAWYTASLMLWLALSISFSVPSSVYDNHSTTQFIISFLLTLVQVMVMYAIFILPTSFLVKFVLAMQNRLSISGYILLIILALTVSGALSYYIFDYVTPNIKNNPVITFRQKMKSSNIIGVSIFASVQSAILLTALWLLRRWDRKAAENSN